MITLIQFQVDVKVLKGIKLMLQNIHRKYIFSKELLAWIVYLKQYNLYTNINN